MLYLKEFMDDWKKGNFVASQPSSRIFFSSVSDILYVYGILI